MKAKSVSKKLFAFLCAVLTCSVCMAQVDVESNDLFSKVDKLIDSGRRMLHGVDTNYVKTACLPWQISLRSRVAQTDLQMHSSIDGASVFDGEFIEPRVKGTGSLNTDPRFLTKVSTAVGVKVGYKGLSIGCSFQVAGDKGENFSLQGVGRWYSVNLRWHRFKMTTPCVHFAGKMLVREDVTEPWLDEAVPWNFKEKIPLDAPMHISTLMFDGFYIFNSKKFSYAAAYNQKTFQLRSAGSWIAGFTGYYADFDYDSSRNADFMVMMDDIGRLRQCQVSLGAGYAYNFVPAKGWLLSTMFMPTVTVLNRTKINTYKTNYKEVDMEHYDDPEEVDYADEYRITDRGSHSRNNKVTLSCNARVSITYNWSRFFINANGQFDNFNYKHKGQRGHLNDWYVNAAVGVRL